MTVLIAERHAAVLDADRGRVIARLFLPGEELHQTRSRVAEIVARVMALDEADVLTSVDGLLRTYAGRHHEYAQLLARHASIVVAHVGADLVVTSARTLLLGATFTAEYATEGAALCNPSAVLHPDQSGLASGQARVAVSLRGIGEGHLSSISFCSAVVGPGRSWRFDPRRSPSTAGVSTPVSWARDHFTDVLSDQGNIDELGSAVLNSLPRRFTSIGLEHALAHTHQGLLTRPGAAATLELFRKVVSSAYVVEFDDSIGLDQRVLIPSAPEESNGMEDARFTRFVEDDGSVEYRATYTAYDGHRIAPRLLTSPDLRTFRALRLAGAAARNKGMALFPRPVGGRYLALCRSDGESTGLTSSVDGLVWAAPEPVQSPSAPWELLQIGNCGAPIETDRGWLVLTHGVGPMRTYSIGAILLDLKHPSRVVGRLRLPLLVPTDGERDGYVPNVVYSCGAFLHDDLLWIPYGIGDVRIGVACADLIQVLDYMDEPTPTRYPDSGE